jgi:hypothetical protein
LRLVLSSWRQIGGGLLLEAVDHDIAVSTTGTNGINYAPLKNETTMAMQSADRTQIVSSKRW